jgi:HAD superfamily hydrolase (TIGR01509 family)
VIEALLFDWDGLVIDTETTWARVFSEALAEKGYAIEVADLAHLVGVAGAEFEEEWARFAAKHLDPAFDRGTVIERILPQLQAAIDALEPLPGVVELLQLARDRSWRTGIATGSQRRYVLPRLERLGLDRWFDDLVTIDDVSRGKPSPDIYVELGRRLDVEPSRCVVFEDSSHGAHAAIAAGMRVIVCPCSVTTRHTFPDGALLVRSLADVQVGTLEALVG